MLLRCWSSKQFYIYHRWKFLALSNYVGSGHMHPVTLVFNSLYGRQVCAPLAVNQEGLCVCTCDTFLSECHLLEDCVFKHLAMFWLAEMPHTYAHCAHNSCSLSVAGGRVCMHIAGKCMCLHLHGVNSKANPGGKVFDVRTF